MRSNSQCSSYPPTDSLGQEAPLLTCDQGTVAHRLQGKAFPTQKGSLSLLPSEDVEFVTLFPSHRSASDGAKALIKQKFVSVQEERAEHKIRVEEVRRRLQQFARTNQSRVMQQSQTLRSLSRWVPVPARCDRHALIYDAETLCGKYDASTSPSLSSLARDWQGRHQAIPKQRKINVKAVAESRCLRESCCTCRQSGREGRKARFMWSRVKEIFQTVFADKIDATLLLDAEIAILWAGRSGNLVREVIITHIPLMYLRPYRPTLLYLDAVDQKELDRFHAVVLEQEPYRKNFHDAPSEADLFTLQARIFQMRAAFTTIMSFCTTLSVEMEWSITVLRLSQRLCPFPHSQGRVKAWIVKGPFPFWQGAAELECQRFVRERERS